MKLQNEEKYSIWYRFNIRGYPLFPESFIYISVYLTEAVPNLLQKILFVGLGKLLNEMLIVDK